MSFQKILQPLAHTLQVPGKQILTKFAHAYNYWLKVAADKLIVLKVTDDTFHYSLIL